MLKYPVFFTVFKWAGGLYLGYIGVQMWRSRGRLAIQEVSDSSVEVSLCHWLLKVLYRLLLIHGHL